MLRRLAEDVVLALGFMTRLPVAGFAVRDERRLAEALWAMPLAGLLLGLLAAAVHLGATSIGLGGWVAAVLALAALALASGGLHDDGLADFWDGIGGGHTRQRRLEIMRDSHVGSYGVLALVITYVLLAGLLNSVAATAPAIDTAAVIITATALSRSAVVVPMIVLRPARDDGLAHLFGQPTTTAMAVATVWPVAAALILGPPGALAIIIGCAAGAGAVTGLAARYLGGHTGDVFGAAIMTSFAGGLIGANLVV